MESTTILFLDSMCVQHVCKDDCGTRGQRRKLRVVSKNSYFFCDRGTLMRDESGIYKKMVKMGQRAG